MKLWKWWCNKVDKHNKPLMESWATSDEVWGYEYIFMPLIVGLLSALFLIIGIYFNKGWYNGVLKEIKTIIILPLTFTIFMYLCIFLNWKCYDYKE